MSKDIITALGLIVAFLIVVGTVAAMISEPSLPRCPEDAVILGGGEYSGITRHWDYYYCGPSVDDYNVH